MPWLAVEIQYYDMVPREDEVIFTHEPRRYTISPFSSEPDMNRKRWNVGYGHAITLPKGTIKKLIGRDLTWEDEPVEI